MITTFSPGQFSPQIMYSPINVIDYGFYPQGQPPVPPPPGTASQGRQYIGRTSGIQLQMGFKNP